MIAKLFTVRDRQTLGDAVIRCYAIRVAAPAGSPEAAVLEETPGGVVPGVILLGRLDVESEPPCYSPTDWTVSGRAMRIAHQHLADHWFDIGSGSELDVEQITRDKAGH